MPVRERGLPFSCRRFFPHACGPLSPLRRSILREILKNSLALGPSPCRPLLPFLKTWLPIESPRAFFAGYEGSKTDILPVLLEGTRFFCAEHGDGVAVVTFQRERPGDGPPIFLGPRAANRAPNVHPPYIMARTTSPYVRPSFRAIASPTG